MQESHRGGRHADDDADVAFHQKQSAEQSAASVPSAAAMLDAVMLGCSRT
jgi:hypothetical protein